ncbi:thiol reductant ABC exporter subunit CydC [Colwellia ponticola]|uniref:Thiol reductant ABC exporter subunit CydC n=1 Tax=Colwellia ponticola TaxID=2304625 RepID=A0A8H2PNE7_9GAMM|nr:thiol reductant ABC exporter subunit CydC [Colwellia ponticola]TMM46430.1 thiol reductant ABC exporter subunit CydC [Colwellia ponticola]
MKIFIRLVSLLKPQLPLMLLGGLLSVITVLANISLLAVSGWFITLMALAGTTGMTVNYFTPAAIIRFLAIVRTAGRYAERMLTHRATFNALAHLRHYFYQQLEPLLPYYRVDLRSGDLLARLQQDIDNLDNFYLRVLLPMMVALISVPIVCYALAQFSPVIAWLMLSALLVVAVIFPLISYVASIKLSQQKTQLESHLTEALVNGIGAIKTLLVYQVGIQYQRTIASITKQYFEVRYRLVKINAALTALTFLLINLSALACLFILIPQLATGDVDIKSLVAVILLVLVSFETVSSMPLAMQLLPQSMASATRLFAIIDKDKPVDIGTEVVKHGDIHFENFTFSYPEQKIATLFDINLSIKTGEKVAIIGASGAGKSTLINLLMGFWPTGLALTSLASDSTSELAKGRITIAGTELSLLKQGSLREHIALMSQQGYLFDASIADNLRLAKSDATEQEMREVCQLVNLSSFIDSLPTGLDTWLGATGTGLSGGQAQRLQIAQLLLRPAKVLILDEPTKGLDRLNEEAIMSNILAYVKLHQQTLLVITHKPLMLEQMDKIVVMENGRVVAQGSHQQLVSGEVSDKRYYQNLLNYF